MTKRVKQTAEGSPKLNSNMLFSVLYRLSICVLPLVVTPYIARVLSPDDNGAYVFTSTIACFFIMFCKLGLESYGNRTIAACRDDPEERSRAFFSLYIIQLIASAVSVLAYIGMVGMFITERRTVYWLQLMYVLSGLFDVSWFFYGMERFKLTTARSLISRGLIIVGVFLFVKTENDLAVYTGVMAGLFLLEQLMLVPCLGKFVHPVKITFADVKKHLVPNFKLFVPILALNLYHWTDKLMLGFFCDDSTISYYNYAESIINLPKGVIQALSAVLLPRFAYMVARNKLSECKKLMVGSMELVCFAACALCFGIVGVSPVFVPFFLGEAYRPTILLTIELAIVVLPMSISDAIQSQYLVPFKKDNLNMAAITLGAIVNIVMNLILIPIMGASGAVIGTLLAESTVFVFLIVRIRDVIGFGKMLSSLLPYMLFGALEAGLALLLGRLPLPPVPRLAVMIVSAAALYLALSCAYFAIRRKRDISYESPVTFLKNSRVGIGGDD